MPGTIIVDPPWNYGRASDHYKLSGYSNFNYQPLTEAELGALPVAQCADYLFLWTTGPFIETAYRLVRHWGYAPVTFMAWVKTNNLERMKEPPFKPQYGVGYWFRGCVEPIIVAKKPGVRSIRTPWIGLLCDSAAHSRKPDSLHDLIEQSMAPDNFPQPWTELFARRARASWTCIGDEIDGKDIRTWAPPSNVAAPSCATVLEPASSLSGTN